MPLSDAAQALLAVKTLGKDPSGSGTIGTAGNLSTLLALSNALKDSAASSEALRCIANALLLVEQTRTTFVDEDVGGGEFCVSHLEASLLSFLLQSKSITFLCRFHFF